MNIIEQNAWIAMKRDDLDGFPRFPLPDGYAVRWYQPGDEEAWRAIHVVADQYNTFTPDVFAEQFGTDGERLAQRQCYLVDPSGAMVGTASGWHGDAEWGESCGRIHWVAIVPEHQGRGLAKPLMSIVCERLWDLGHRSAFLTSSTARLAAINLYLRFGFRPGVRNREDHDVWRQLQPQVKYPFDLIPPNS